MSSKTMGKFYLFDSHSNVLLMIYNINSPVCILLNLLAIYLIMFKSSREMGEYRWYLLHYQPRMPTLIFFFFPLVAVRGYGFIITKMGFSTSTCLVRNIFVATLGSFSFHSDTIFLSSPVYCSELFQNPEAMELLKISTVYYVPSSFVLRMSSATSIFAASISGTFILAFLYPTQMPVYLNSSNQ
uniref:Serpentine receptor class gamma n=1 Tax=Heterorhabditis bacteriophora TaxID=37862 RepID=A0A1I7WEL5_HETBA